MCHFFLHTNAAFEVQNRVQFLCPKLVRLCVPKTISLGVQPEGPIVSCHARTTAGQTSTQSVTFLQVRALATALLSGGRVFTGLPSPWCLPARHIVERAPILEQSVWKYRVTNCRPWSEHILGGSSSRVKNNRKGRKKTGFEIHQIIIILMDMCSTT